MINNMMYRYDAKKNMIVDIEINTKTVSCDIISLMHYHRIKWLGLRVGVRIRVRAKVKFVLDLGVGMFFAKIYLCLFSL